MKLTKEQRHFLSWASRAPEINSEWVGVCCRRGQHAMVGRLVQLGLLRGVGYGHDENSESGDPFREVEVFAITDEGRKLLAREVSKFRVELRDGAQYRLAAGAVKLQILATTR